MKLRSVLTMTTNEEAKPKTARANMRLHQSLTTALKASATKRGIPYQREIREAIKRRILYQRSIREAIERILRG